MRRSTLTSVRDYVASAAGIAGPIGQFDEGSSSSAGNMDQFADLPITSVLFPVQKSRAQVVKINRGAVTQEKKAVGLEEGYTTNVAVKAFTQNILLNSDFIDTKKKPKVLISVTGGAGAYVIPPAIEPIFSKGLMKTARATNAWIVTGGTDSGVMKTVGDAYHKHAVDNVPCIGIASYNAINNKEILLGEKQVEYNAVAGPAPKLNPYHTHFVLVDGTTFMKNPNDVFGHEIEFRSDLESYLCSEEMFNIPLLLVVVGGGPGTLKTVYEGIVRKFPVVVLDKTGGVADAISYRIQLKTTPNKRHEKDEWDAWVKREGARITPEHEEFMQMIVEASDFVRIYDPSQGEDSLEVFLFESIFNCDKYGSFMSKMELAVSCNQLEVVSGLIEGCPVNEKSGYMKKTMQHTVQSDRPEILDALIEGTVDRSLDLQRLYKFIFAKRSRWERFYPILSQSTIKLLEQTQSLIKQESKGNFRDIIVSDVPLEQMSPPPASPTLTSHSSFNLSTSALLRQFLKDVFLHSGQIYEFYQDTLSLKLGIIDDSRGVFADMPKEKKSKLKKSKLTDVLLWALLMGHADLAKVLWAHTTLPIHTALISSHFCKLLAEKFANEGTGYSELAVEFETKAIEVLAKLNYKEARAMLSYKYDEFKMNLLAIADLAESKEFTSHPYIQRYVDELLFQNPYGEIAPSTSMWKIVLCIIPFFYFWIYHPKMINNDQLTRGKHSKLRYYTLPVVKFWSNTLCYIGFIVLCSYVLIVSEPSRFDITGPEILLFLWMGALLLEEISQLLEDGPVQYLSRVSNRIDIFMLSLFVIFFILNNESVPVHTAATDLFVVATIIVYLRLLNMFAFSPQLGPLYFVVLQCIDDILQWLFIFVLFCFGTTIAIIVCVKQNGLDPFKPFTEGGSFAVAFYTIIGEYTDAFGDLNGSAFGIVILSIYALIAQIVLVNLLIAMMGDTFNTVKEDSAKEWRFMRYSLATEYSSTSAVAPPFNLLFIPMQIKNQFAKPKKARKQKEVGGVSFRRLKTLARKYVEELQDDEKESKKKNLDYIADSVKSSIKKFGQDTARKLGEIADSPAMTTRNANNSNNNNNNNNSSKDSANVQAQLAELQKAVATIQAGLQKSSQMPSTNSIEVQVGSKSITVLLGEGINTELARRALNEFGPLASWIQALQTGTWDKLEVHMHSIFTAPNGTIEFVNFSTKIGSKE